MQKYCRRPVSSPTPLQGIAYFAAHRALWRPLLSVVAPTLATGLAVTAAMFAFTYVPQATVLALVNGPLAIVATVLLVLSESSTLLSVLAKTFLIDDALVDTFDATLLARDLSAVVQTERHVKPGSGPDPVAKLGKLVTKPFAKFTPRALVRYLMYLPLNLIPVVGTVLFVLLQGRKTGPAAHARYFQLKQMKRHERDEFIEKRKAAYTRCGNLWSRQDRVMLILQALASWPLSWSSSPWSASSSPSPTPSAPRSGLPTWRRTSRRRQTCASRLVSPRRTNDRSSFRRALMVQPSSFPEVLRFISRARIQRARWPRTTDAAPRGLIAEIHLRNNRDKQTRCGACDSIAIQRRSPRHLPGRR